MTPEQIRVRQVIANYKQTFAEAKSVWEEARQRKQEVQWLYVADKPRLNWNDEWDGLLVQRALDLADHGYWVTQIYRKQKIVFRTRKDMTRQMIANDLFLIYGNSFRGISFDPNAVWWGISGSKYRG